MHTPIDTSLLVMWKFITGVMVFFMQAGFAMLEAGSVQRKNIKNILMKNSVDVCVAGVTFWLFGYGFAFGCKGGDCKDFIGDSNWALSHFKHDLVNPGYILWYFQFAFAATASTIVSGSVAERMRLIVYMTHTALMSGFIYPVVAHWLWGGGWLYKNGVIDYSGGIGVHIVGGLAGLAGAIAVGPRFGRFEGPLFRVTVHDFPTFSPTFGALGVLILWFGWYGFNCGNVPQLTGFEETIETIAINTTLGPTGAVLMALAISAYNKFEDLHFFTFLNSCLAGLVSITPGCAVLDPPVAFAIGAVGTLAYLFGSYLLEQLRIDDPVGAAPVHLFGGIWGTLAVGLCAVPDRVKAVYPDSPHHTHAGLFYGDHSGTLLLWQFIGIISTMAWVFTCSFLFFLFFRLRGTLRVSQQTEMMGLDHVMHGGQEAKSVAINGVTGVLQENLVDRLVALASV